MTGFGISLRYDFFGQGKHDSPRINCCVSKTPSLFGYVDGVINSGGYVNEEWGAIIFKTLGTHGGFWENSRSSIIT